MFLIVVRGRISLTLINSLLYSTGTLGTYPRATIVDKKSSRVLSIVKRLR